MKNYLLTCFLASLCLIGSTLKAQSKVVESPPDKDLVYQSGIPGQEGASPSARMEGTILFFELPNKSAPDTLWLTYWHELLKDHIEVTPGVQIALVATSGSFFTGNAGFKAYSWVPPQTDSHLYFSLLSGDTYLLRHWLVFPEDQVRIRMGLSTGQTLFTGPSADFFKAQMGIASLSKEMELQAHPLMVTGDPQKTLSDSLVQKLFQASKNLPKTMYPEMQFLIPKKNEKFLLDSLLAHPLYEAPLIHELPKLLDNMDSRKQVALEQRAWGELLKQILARVSLSSNSLSSASYKKAFQKWTAEIPQFESAQSFDPLYTQGIYDLVFLEAKVSNTKILEQLGNLPKGMKDRIMGLYLLSNYKQLEGTQWDLAKEWQQEIKTPYIRQMVSDLHIKYQKGVPVYPPPLDGFDGKLFDLQSLEGKSLVLSFWITGCKFCIRYYEETLRPVFEHFREREDIVFVSVNADKTDQLWHQSVATERYSHAEMIQLHQDAGTGILEDYKIASFPQKLLISPDFSLFLLTINQYSASDLIIIIETMADQSYSNPEPKMESL